MSEKRRFPWRIVGACALTACGAFGAGIAYAVFFGADIVCEVMT